MLCLILNEIIGKNKQNLYFYHLQDIGFCVISKQNCTQKILLATFIPKIFSYSRLVKEIVSLINKGVLFSLSIPDPQTVSLDRGTLKLCYHVCVIMKWSLTCEYTFVARDCNIMFKFIQCSKTLCTDLLPIRYFAVFSYKLWTYAIFEKLDVFVFWGYNLVVWGIFLHVLI